MSNIDDSTYNKKIDAIEEEPFDYGTSSLDFDRNYFNRLKLQALVENNENALAEYTKLNEVLDLKNKKYKLLQKDENGNLRILKYNLSPESYIYILSRYLDCKGFKDLFKIENYNGKREFVIRKLGIKDSEIARLLCDIRNVNLRKKLFLERIQDENGEEIPAIMYLLHNQDDVKTALCSPYDFNEDIVKNLINNEYGDYGEELAELVLLNSNSTILRNLLDDEKIFVNKPQLVEEIKRKIEILKNLRDGNASIDVEKDFKIPLDMTVGVEFETLGPISKFLHSKLIGRFEGKEDITLKDKYYGGIEIVSPILKNSSINDALYVAEKLKELGQFTNETCGGHIHIGAEYLTIKDSEGNEDLVASKLAWKSFLELWKNTEEIMYKISNKEGEEHRGISYTKPVAEKIEKMLKKIKIDNRKSLEEFKAELKEIQIEEEPIMTERNFAVNLDNLDNKKNTIEFRLFNGTLDKNELEANIMLCTRLVYISRELGIIQSKLLRNIEIIDEEKQTLEIYRGITSKEEVSEEEKFEKLLELICVNEENKEIYRNRYQKSNFDIKREVEKMNQEKECDYEKYGDSLSESEERKLMELNRLERDRKREIRSSIEELDNNVTNEDNIVFLKEDLGKLAEKTIRDNPSRFQIITSKIRNFVNQMFVRARILDNNQGNEH